MIHKKKLTVKILLFIGVPIAIIFIVIAAIVTQTVKQSVSQLTTSDLTSKSQAASYEINNYFSKYVEIARQMSANTQFEQTFQKTTSGKSIVNTEGFADVKQTLINVQKGDSENIVVAWISDIDSSQLTQSDGYLSKSDWKVTERPWYKQLMQKQDVIITEPYEDTATKKLIVSVVAPVYQSGTKNLLGVTSIDFNLDKLYKMMDSYKLGKTGFYMLASADGQLIYHPDQALKQKNITESNMSKNAIEAMQAKKAGFLSYTAMGTTNYGYISPVGTTGWTIATGLPESEFNSTSNAVQTTVVTIFSIAILIVLLLIITISKSIVNPLIKLKNAANQIADGNLDVSINVKSTDEVGQVSTALSRTVARLKQYIVYIDEVSATLDQIAIGNLVFELRCDYVGEFSKIKTSLENIKKTLVHTFSEIDISANQVSSGSDQVAGASQSLAQGATEQASSIEQLSASITEIANQVRQNATNATTANSLSTTVSAEIVHGNELMHQMTDAMTDISTSSNQIGAIIKTIDDIAFQTNILALNAAVEAARAGSAGKGFAVVADEVRNLASKSARAAKDTTALIESAIQSVQHGTKIADETAQSLSSIITSNNTTSSLIKEISEACDEQATSIQQVTLGVDQISAVVQTNSATSEETAASSEELSGQAQSLMTLVQQFKLKKSDIDAPIAEKKPIYSVSPVHDNKDKY